MRSYLLGIVSLFLLPVPVQSASGDISVNVYFSNFQNIELRHIKSVRQKGGGCAWYALCNARAIDQLYSNDQVIDAKSIKAIVKKEMFPALKKKRDSLLQRLEIRAFFEGLHADEQIRLARYLKLSNYYLAFLYPAKKWLYLSLPEVSDELSCYVEKVCEGDDLYQVTSPKLFFNTFLSQKKVMHFLISVRSIFDGSDSNHGVLVTVLWNPDQEKPTVIYMDSNNVSLGEYTTWVLFPALYCFLKTMNEALASESSHS